MNRPQLHFYRYEIKYLLPQPERRDVEAELHHFLRLDPFVEGLPGSRYFVRSLYWDDALWSCYYEKIDGLMRRSKFRLRTYGSADGLGHGRETAFLEIKGRHNALVFKHRIGLVEHDGRPALDPSTRNQALTRAVLDRTPDGPIKNLFQVDVARRRIRPRMLIDYSRRPYYSKDSPDFRLTFDDELAAWAVDRLSPAPYHARRSLVPGCTILEVKFRDQVPKWFQRLVQTYELQRLSVSKFCLGVEAFGLTPKLE